MTAVTSADILVGRSMSVQSRSGRQSNEMHDEVQRMTQAKRDTVQHSREYASSKRIKKAGSTMLVETFFGN